MGGRGAPSPFSRRRSLWVDTESRGYSVVTSEDRPAGAKFHFFDQIATAGHAGGGDAGSAGRRGSGSLKYSDDVQMMGGQSRDFGYTNEGFNPTPKEFVESGGAEELGYFDKTFEPTRWTVISTDPNSDKPVERHRDHTFGMTEPTLKWFKDGQMKELYMEGVTTEQYLERSGLSFSYKRGEEEKLFKRMSRVMRSYTVEQRFDRSEVKIERIDDEWYGKVHDGAGVVSREMLGKFLINSQLPFSKQQAMAEELQHASRVEFTIMTDRGQEKGHAIVSDKPLLGKDGQPVDFILPSDIKTEVKLTDSDSTWVGINFVHGKGKMNMDVQSLVNFGPKAGSTDAFISPEQHARFLRDEVARFEQAVGAGQDPTLKVDAFETPEEIASSPHKEFALSGGDIRHYPTHIARVIDQKTESLAFQRSYENKDRKLQLPVPGARLYMMPDHVGQVARLDISVPRGEVYMDLERGTAWVNSEDWLQVKDGSDSNPNGLRDIWGGADNDDALWMIPFYDQAPGAANSLKVLAWRSPNEDGEYMVLRPTENSDLPKWRTAEGETIYGIEANSEHLPTRVDHADRSYQGMVTEPSGGERVDGFVMADMEDAAGRGALNAGTLGGYINLLMVYRAANGQLPKNLPASTEEIIDAMNKTGGDLKKVKRYYYDLSAHIATSGVPIPRYLSDRLIFDPELSREDRDLLRSQIRYTAGDHHVDRVTQAVQWEIDQLQQLKEKMVGEAHAPNKLYDTVFHEPDADRYFNLGADLNKTFSHTLYKVVRPEKIRRLKVDRALAQLQDEDGNIKEGFEQDALKIRAYADGRLSHDEVKATEFKHGGIVKTLTKRPADLSDEEKTSLEFTPQDFDRAKWSVWNKLTHYSPTEQGKILRAGLADDLLAGKGGKSMWRYAVRDEVGGMLYHDLPPEVAHELQKTGLGNAMNQALREVGLLNYHTDEDGGLQLQSLAQGAGEPNSYRPIRFSGLAQLPNTNEETFLHIWKKPGVNEDGLIAQTPDGRLFGEITNGDLNAGDRIRLKYSKPSSTGGADLFGVFEQLT